jgi:hypothetical protein
VAGLHDNRDKPPEMVPQQLRQPGSVQLPRLLRHASCSHGDVVAAPREKQVPGCGHERDGIAGGAVASGARLVGLGFRPIRRASTRDRQHGWVDGDQHEKRLGHHLLSTPGHPLPSRIHEGSDADVAITLGVRQLLRSDLRSKQKPWGDASVGD